MNSTTNTVLPETSFTLSFTVRNSGLLFCYTAEEKPLFSAELVDGMLAVSWFFSYDPELLVLRAACVPGDRIVLRKESARIALFVNDALQDEEWPYGTFAAEKAVLKEKQEGLVLAFLSPAPEEMDTDPSCGGSFQGIRGWMPGNGVFAGDCMPFVYEDRFHLLYLYDRHHHRSKWGKGAHQWAHLSSPDLLHFDRHPMAVRITEPEEASICTGSWIFLNGRHYLYYTVRTMDGSPAPVRRSVSDDGIRFEKDPAFSFSLSERYTAASARDPKLVQAPDGSVHMLVTTRLKSSGLGCLVHLTSADGEHFTECGELLVSENEDEPECADHFYYGGYWYLVYSLRLKAHYLVSRSPFTGFCCPGEAAAADPEDTVIDAPSRGPVIPCSSVPKAAVFRGRLLFTGFHGIDGYAGSVRLMEAFPEEDGTLRFAEPPEAAEAERLRIQAGGLSFEIDADAKHPCFVLSGYPEAGIPDSDFFRLVLDDGVRTEIPVFAKDQQGKAAYASDGTLVIDYPELVSSYGDRYRIRFTVRIRTEDGLLKFIPSLENHTADVRINECFCPLADFASLTGDPADDLLYMPEGPGTRVRDPWRAMRERRTDYYAHGPYESCWHVHYPNASMSWFGIQSGSHFLYIARLDPEIRACFLTVRQHIRPDLGDLMLGIDHFPAACPGEALTLPESVIGLLHGDFRAGAKRYRAWADEHFYKTVPKVPWVQGMTGWQRLILRSQYGEDYVRPEELPEVCRIGKEHGLNTIFLFGWWKGGLDRGYPDIDEEPYEGYFDALRENIKKVQDLGGNIILALGVHFMDPSGEFYKKIGKDLVIRNADGIAVRDPKSYPGIGEMHHTHAVRQLVLACSCTEEWRNTQLKNLRFMETLGANCLFLDCYGGWPIDLCFDRRHEHGKRVDAEWTGHRKSFAAAEAFAAAHGRVLGTEVVTDIAASYCQFIHGLLNIELLPGSRAFPQMFRYTFPEVISTNRAIRHSEGPYLKQLKWSLVLGLRMDAELFVCRAAIDRDPDYAAAVKQYCGLLKQYEDYLLYGTFTLTDEVLGFPDEVKCGEYVHREGKKLLRVLYNASDKETKAGTLLLRPDELHFEELDL